ncbi:MAG: RagB/SusD family nutrient uptake outer membrane protein [Prevotella sp.]|nr:RagB/SusD family nutrient uptake outer membrane protein [Prevotella sp.]
MVITRINEIRRLLIGAALITYHLLLITSCSGDFLEEYSQDLSRVQTADDLNELLIGDCTMPLGLFSNTGSYFQYQNANYAILHFMGDELQENLEISQDPDGVGIRNAMFPYFTWQQNCFVDYESKSTLESAEEHYWALAYERLNNCNIVIDAAQKMELSGTDETLRQQVLGECHFLRANYYFLLANLYGRAYSPSTADAEPCVPIKLTASVDDVEYQRNSVAEVYAQILADLDAAENYLKDKAAPRSIYHVGLTAVYIFRSRVHLFIQQWEEARHYARLSLTENDALQDIRNFASTAFPISASNPEVVYSNGSSCLGNLLFQAPSRRSSIDYMPVYSISDHLVALFSETDARLNSYITFRADLYANTPTYHKIDNSTASYGKYKEVSDVFSIRTAESYLNQAEAEAHLGGDQEACRLVNALRSKRVTTPSDTILTGQRLVQFIREERERELFLEGHRWFDLRRYQVDTQYPYTTVIEHTMTWYTTKKYVQMPSYTNYYRLEPGDDGYTLNIPKSVRDFQQSIGSNPRPVRQPFETVSY